MEFILVIGLIVLFAMHLNQSARLRRLEEALDAFRSSPHEGSGDERPVPASASVPPAMPPRELAAWVARPAPQPRADWNEVLGDTAPAEKEPAEAPGERETLGSLFERMVGGRMLIWVGGVALAVAGVLLVRYSIERGWATPPVRMIMSAIFGFVLLAAGEVARRRPGAEADPRVAQALVGAAILVLYATPYGAHVLYDLIPTRTASALMVIVTAAALFLSLRHGPPTAVLGLAGGFATPALVGGDAGAIPLITYLALLDIALFVLARRCGWTWLAAAAIGLSFVWTLYLTSTPRADALAGGVFILALGVAGSLVQPGPGRQLAMLRPAGIGLIQLAILVARTDLGREAWLLFGALSLAAILLAGRRSEFRLLPAFALVLALMLLAAKADGRDPHAPSAAIGITLLFGAAALAEALRRGGPPVWVAIGAAAFTAPVIILRTARPDLLGLAAWGGLSALLALGPLALAWSRRAAADDRRIDPPLLLAAGSAMLLLAVAAGDLMPDKLLSAAWLALAAASAFAGRAVRDRALFLLAFFAALFAGSWAAGMMWELWLVLSAALAGEPAFVTALPSPASALQLLILPAGLLFLVRHWLDGRLVVSRNILLAAAGLFLAGALYIVFKQIFQVADDADFVARGFAERIVLTQLLFAAGWLLCGGRVEMPWLEAKEVRMIGLILTGCAAARLAWFDLLLHNPAFDAQYVGPLPVLNLLAPAFLLSAFWLYVARRRADSDMLSGAWLAGFLTALIAGAMLLVRQPFHGAILSEPVVPTSEFYAYSLAGLLLSIAIMLAGIRLPDKGLRLAGLVLLSATIVKVFLFDAAELEGILRILSFVGLGVGVIGIGMLYTTVLRAEAKPASS